MTTTDLNRIAEEMRARRNADDKHLAWKAWKRAVNASRKLVAKQMKALGYEVSIWTKTDKGRTIVQIKGQGDRFDAQLKGLVQLANRKYQSKLVLEGRQVEIAVSDYRQGDWATLITKS